MSQHLTQSDWAVLLDRAIKEYFEYSVTQAKQIDPSYQRLWEILRDLINSGGKRLRPHMTLYAYRAFGGQDIHKLVPIAVAQELLHFSLLIHDDIIDRDYIRYGTDNIAGSYLKEYAKHIDSDGDRVHFAHSAAILGGDLVLSGAHSLIASSELSDSEKTSAQRLLSRAIFEVAGGEQLDTESSFMPYRDGSALNIARYKTAGYSFIAPLVTGATIAGASEKQINHLREFAIALGVAFQLVDDLLGVFGEEATTGKSTTSDITEGKRTFMIEKAVQAMNSEQKSRFDALFGKKDASPFEIDEIKQLLISTDAKLATEKEINAYVITARQLLATLEFNKEDQDTFDALIKKVTDRTH